MNDTSIPIPSVIPVYLYAEPAYNFSGPKANSLNVAHSIFFIQRLVDKKFYNKTHYRIFTITKFELDIFYVETTYIKYI